MKKSKVKVAVDSALILSAAGVLAAFPFREHFLGGLLLSTCNAAVIGGLADSFAVGALFGNPLGIKWPAFMGTRVIARNRNRLIHELGHMVQNELLTTASIKAILDDYSISSIIIRYLRESGGQADLVAITERLAKELINHMDIDELSVTIRELFLGNPEAVSLSDIAADIGDWTIQHGYDDQLIDFLIDELISIVRTDRFRLILERLASSVLSTYENGNFRRQFVNLAAGLDAKAISSKIQGLTERFLDDMHMKTHSQRLKLKSEIERFVTRLRDDMVLRATLEQRKIEAVSFLKTQIDLAPLIQQWTKAILEQPEASAPSMLHDWMDQQLSQQLNRWSAQEEQLRPFDDRIKTIIFEWVEQKQSLITGVITDKLSTYSEEELSQLVQDKAGRDLQYIRLNGLVVGSLIGLFLYLLNFWVEGGRG